MQNLNILQAIIFISIGAIIGFFIFSGLFYYYSQEEVMTIYNVCRGIETIPKHFDNINIDYTRYRENGICLDSDRKLYIQIANGTSMLPFLSDGRDRFITLKDFEFDELEPGHLIIYEYTHNKSRAHIIEEKSYENGIPCFIVKGTNNIFKDSKCIKFDNITSVVVGVLPA